VLQEDAHEEGRVATATSSNQALDVDNDARDCDIMMAERLLVLKRLPA